MIKDFTCLQEYGITEGDIGILRVLFPTAKITKVKTPFQLEPTIVLYKKGRCSKTLGYLPYKSGEPLNTKSGILKFVKEQGLCKHTKDYEEVPDDLFWIYLKQDLLGCYIPKNRQVSDTNMLDFLECIGKSFPDLYKTYKDLQIPHRVLFASLLTMLNKIFVDTGSLKYNKLLQSKKNYLKVVVKHCVSYINTRQTEDDFLKFLLDLSLEGNT